MNQTIFINGRFLAQPMTGVQRYALETLLALDRLLLRGEGEPGWRFELLVPDGAVRPELTCISVRVLSGLRGHAWEQLSLAWAARSGFLLSFGPSGPLALRDQLVTFHDASVHAIPSAFSRKFRAWYKFLQPALVRRGALLMTVSEFSRRELTHYLGLKSERLRVSGEGWEHVLRIIPESGLLARHGLRRGRYVLAVGSLAPHKNFALVARALELLGRPSFDVVVAGGVDARIFAGRPPSTLAALKFVGRVSDGELRALYENAAAFVYPSLYEGFGVPPLEAMALGCPVLASGAAAMPEVCGDAAWYFSPQDAAALACAMRRIFEDPEGRAALIQRGHERLRQHGWEAAARCHLAALSERLAPARARERALVAEAAAAKA